MLNKKTGKRLFLFTFFLLSALLAGGCSSGKAPSAKENLAPPQPSENAGRDSYDIRLNLDTEEKAISGSVTVKLSNTSKDTWPQLCFRDYISAIGQTYDEMSGSSSDLKSEFTGIFDTASQEMLEYSRTTEDSSVLFVDLKSPLAPGESMEIQFDYTARIPENAFRYRYTSLNDGNNLLFELANFYPVLAVYENGEWQHNPFFYEGECFYSKCADYFLTLSVPEEYTVVSSGTEEKGSSEKGLCTWTVKAENMRDIGLTVSDYLVFSEESFEDIQIRCYYFDHADAEKQAGLVLETAAASVKFFTQNIGGYPYKTLDVVMTNDLIGAIEFPAYVRVGDYSEQLNSDDTGYIKNLIIENTAHETAHQWFYAVVGNDSYREPWLDESFASFCALAVQTEGLPRQEADELVSGARTYLRQEDGMYLNLPYDQLGGNYLGTVYEKGKYFLYDLMIAMGEEKFYRMLQDYYSTNAFQEVTAKDFTDMVYKYSEEEKVKELIQGNLTE